MTISMLRSSSCRQFFQRAWPGGLPLMKKSLWLVVGWGIFESSNFESVVVGLIDWRLKAFQRRQYDVGAAGRSLINSQRCSTVLHAFDRITILLLCSTDDEESCKVVICVIHTKLGEPHFYLDT